MVVRRTTAPRKRPVSAIAVTRPVSDGGQSKAAEANSASSKAGARLDDEQRNQIVADFEASLRDQGIETEELEFALHHFKAAIDSAPASVSLQAPDVAAWDQTLNGMVDGGVISEDERNDLAWQLKQAAAVFEDEEVKVALEFAERMERDGEELALDWLNGKRATTGNGKARSEGPVDTNQPVLKQAITNSKSRRLRGPPQR